MFALYLQQYPTVGITVAGQRVDPAGLQVERERYHLGLVGVDGRILDDMYVTVVEWGIPMSRTLYLCDPRGFAVHSLKPDVKAPGFEFTAYVSSAFVRELDNRNALLNGEQHRGVADLVSAAREKLREHFRRRSAERASELMAEWKREDVYPYEGTPATPIERSEREVFDIVALNVNTYLAQFAGLEPKAKRFSLRLLRQGIETNPWSAGASTASSSTTCGYSARSSTSRSTMKASPRCSGSTSSSSGVPS